MRKAHFKSFIITTALISFAAPSAMAQGSLFQTYGINLPKTATSQILMPGASTPKLTASAGAISQFIISSPAPLAGKPMQVLASPTVAAAPQIPVSTADEVSAPEAPMQIAQLDVPNPDVKDIAAAPVQNPWTDILQSYGNDSGVVTLFDYAALSKNSDHMKRLGDYIETLAAQKPSAMQRAEAMAYWANLYNALTVQLVSQNWPVKSIKEIRSGAFSAGPWKRDVISVEGSSMSLDDIEHGTLRKKYPDPRIHYMVNCASIGCPNLMLKAWSADSLEADMDAGASRFINTPRGALVENGKLTVSSIYKWFDEDFGGNDGGVISHLKAYAKGDLKTALSSISKVSKDQYDWDVNAG